jgi:methionine-S-sulfoxide reductase
MCADSPQARSAKLSLSAGAVFATAAPLLWHSSAMNAFAGWVLGLVVILAACSRGDTPTLVPAPESAAVASSVPASSAPRRAESVALLAGGCFWGMEDLFRKLQGVLETNVGYTGGHLESPTYDDVKSGRTGHAESIRVVFDPNLLSYERLLAYFFSIHDPTTKHRQGNDIGTQYRSAIFVFDSEQRRIAEKVIERVASSGDWKAPVTTEISGAFEFYPAEEYHQDYLQKNPGGYTCHYQRDVSYY